MAQVEKQHSSRLECVLDRVGQAPDRELAEEVGVSTENVRAYRIRHGIPAAWRGETAVVIHRDRSAVSPGGRLRAPARPAAADRWAFILDYDPPRQAPVLTIGADLESAVQVGLAQAQGSRLVGVRCLGVAL